MNVDTALRSRSAWAAVLLLAGLLAQAGAFGDEIGRRALLIGINRYAASELPDLRGAVNDTIMMRQVLETRFGFSPQDITVLTDEQATRQAILAAIGELVDAAGPRDVVYIHYSGHGSQVEDLNHDETDGGGMDETIVPHDGRTGDIPDITDDELGALLSRLETEHAVIVLDSCHSGTGTRSSKVIPRSIPNDSRTALYRQPDAIGTRGTVAVDLAKHILLTGAPANQSALDGPIDGDYRGFFSYALARVLGETPAGESLSDIYNRVNGVYQQIQDEMGILLPDPQFEASSNNLAATIFPLLQGQATGPATARAYVDVEPLAAGRVRLRRAAAVGAAADSLWAIYPPGEQRFGPGQAVATARITRLAGEHALAELLDNRAATIRAGSRAIRIMEAPPLRQVPVELRAEPAIAARLRAGIAARIGDVQFVGPNDFARFIVNVGSSCQGCSTEVTISGADGLQELSRFPWTGPEDAASRVAPLISRSIDVSAIGKLTNPASRIELSASIVTQGTGTRGVSVVPSSETARYRIRRAGEPRSHANSLMLEIRTSCDCYVTVVDIDPEGRVGVLFPNPYSDSSGFYRDGLLRAGSVVRIPDSLEEPNAAGFFWDYSPPAGVDTIQVFASTDLATARKIRDHIARVGAQVGTRGGGSFAELRSEVEAGTRGVSLVPAAGATVQSAPDWTSMSLHVRIEP